MSINKELKNYYRGRIEAQKIPEEIDFPFKVFQVREAGPRARTSWLSLVFHLATILLLTAVHLSNSGIFQSLQKLDPDRTKAQVVEQRVKKSIDKIGAYFRPNLAPSNKGGNP